MNGFDEMTSAVTNNQGTVVKSSSRRGGKNVNGDGGGGNIAPDGSALASAGSIPQNFYEKLFEDGKVMTHGYVHGHIHKHKDHTHIHGHIHNHDHDHHNQNLHNNEAANSSGQQENTLESCNEFDDLSLCKDIFCDELDDCFYLQCDNTTEEEKIVCADECWGSCDCEDASDSGSDKHVGNAKCCENPGCLSNTIDPKNSMICTDPSCTDSELEHKPLLDCCNAPEEEYYNHENSLCGLQMSKKPLFEDLINRAHKSLELNEEIGPMIKKQKLEQGRRDVGESIDLHFPHVCHPTPEVSDGSNSFNEVNQAQPNLSANHHHVHQSCFHASIPNAEESPETISDNKVMSDYDFYIQFNNFKSFLDSSKNDIQQATNNEFAMFNDPEFPQEINNSQIPNTTSPTYSCQWDNCFKKVSDGTIMKHLVNHHIGQEYDLRDKPSKSMDFQASYQCEWNDCNYMNTDLDSLIDHLNCHKGNTEFSHDENIAILTPSSSGKSTASSPKNSSTIPNASSASDVNITSIKFLPQTRNSKECCSTLIDPTFTCKWQIGTDEFGKPIHCGRTHDLSGDLHNHLIDDHIGLGKSTYTCNWVGCDRHNGKCFRQRQKLLRHIHIHTNFKPCKCEICGSTFAVDSMLKQHLRIHSGEKPFTCSVCGKTFATGSSLSIHNRIHTGEKPLMCKWPGCGKRFSESSNLTKHMKIHTKAFDCEICGAQFDKKANYTKHIKLHKKSSTTGPNVTSGVVLANV